MTNVQQTKDILGFALGFGNAMNKAMSDGKISLSEIPLFIGAFIKLPAAIQGIAQVPSELSHLDEEGKKEIYDFVKQNSEISDEHVESAIFDGLKLAGDIHGYAKKYFVKA